MYINLQREEFSRAYVAAVAAVAGYATYRPSVDDDSIDLGIAARGSAGSVRSPRVELQLKCSSTLLEPGVDAIPFEVKRKNYDDLRPEDLMVPRILVVVIVPELAEDWMVHAETELVLRRCGYWRSLRSEPATDNMASVTIHMPRTQLFSPESLRAMMIRIGDGGRP